MVLQPSLTGHSKVVTHDVPVGVVPRRLWGDLAEPEMPDFDVCSSVIICSTAVVLTFKTMIWGYWHQRADERFGDPPQRWIQEPSVVRDRDGRPPKGPSGTVLLLCV